MKRYKKQMKSEIKDIEDLLVEDEQEITYKNISIEINEDVEFTIKNIEPGSGGVGMVDITLDELRAIAAYYIKGEFV